jgi:hypothetical protein
MMYLALAKGSTFRHQAIEGKVMLASAINKSVKREAGSLLAPWRTGTFERR